MKLRTAISTLIFVLPLALGLIVAAAPASAQATDPIINNPNDTVWYGSGLVKTNCIPAPLEGCVVGVSVDDCVATGDGTTCKDIFIEVQAGSPTGKAGTKICANFADTGRSTWTEENGNTHPIDFSGSGCVDSARRSQRIHVHGNYQLGKPGVLPNGGLFSVVAEADIAVVKGKGTSLP